MTGKGKQHYDFETFIVDVDNGAVLRGGEEISLRRQSLEVLLYLIEHRGTLVTKDELIAAVWRDIAVTDNSLTQCLVEIRRAIGDNEHRIVRTVVRRGYLFDAPEDHNEAESEQPDQRPNRWVVAAAIAGLAALALVFALLEGDSEVQPEVVDGRTGKPSIALLAFENLSKNEGDLPFINGIREEVATQLGRVEGLRVVSMMATSDVLDGVVSMQELSDTSGVDYLLTGSVLRAGDTLRLTAQLNDGETHTQVWAETYDVELSVNNLLETERKVAVAIATMLGMNVLPDHYISVSARGPANLEALDLFYNGLYYMRLMEVEGLGPNERNVHAAVGRFEASIAADSEWAPPHFTLGRLMHFWASRAGRGNSIHAERFEAARRHLDRALELDHEYKPALSSLAFVQMVWDRDLEAGLQTYKRIQALGGASYWINGLYLMHARRFEEARDEFLKQFAFSPNVSSHKFMAGRASLCAGRYREAIGYFDEFRVVSPKWKHPPILNRLESWSYLKLGERDKGLQIAERVATDSGSDVSVAAHFAIAGMHDRARATLRDVDDPLEPDLEFLFDTALALGDHERALDYLELSIDSFDPGRRFLRCEGRTEPLEDHARFQRIVNAIGLPQ